MLLRSVNVISVELSRFWFKNCFLYINFQALCPLPCKLVYNFSHYHPQVSFTITTFQASTIH